MGDNIQDTLDATMSAIVFGAAVTVLLIAISLYQRNLDYAAGNIDEKQSIVTSKNVQTNLGDPTGTIQTNPALASKDTQSGTEVLNNILMLENPEETVVTINGIAVDFNKIKLAQDGDQRSRSEIMDMISLSGSYEKTNIYSVRDDGRDYLASIAYTSV